jgi:hypothetical protein
MAQLVSAPTSPSAGLHPRLRTAFTFLGYCETVTAGRTRRDGIGRDLIAGEVAARNTALELIRNFMSGEVELTAGPAPRGGPLNDAAVQELLRVVPEPPADRVDPGDEPPSN